LWQIKLPTTLIKLRPDDDLPAWLRLQPDTPGTAIDLYASDPPKGPWTWQEDPKLTPPIDVTS
jgi:hypothetical protein